MSPTGFVLLAFAVTFPAAGLSRAGSGWICCRQSYWNDLPTQGACQHPGIRSQKHQRVRYCVALREAVMRVAGEQLNTNRLRDQSSLSPRRACPGSYTGGQEWKTKPRRSIENTLRSLYIEKKFKTADLCMSFVSVLHQVSHALFARAWCFSYI